jgi:hypothetical protein
MVQVVKHQPSKCEALSLNHYTSEKKKEKKRKGIWSVTILCNVYFVLTSTCIQEKKILKESVCSCFSRRIPMC